MHDIPTMRDFIDWLTRDEETGVENDELDDGVYMDTSDSEEERNGFEWPTPSGNQGSNGMI